MNMNMNNNINNYNINNNNNNNINNNNNMSLKIHNKCYNTKRDKITKHNDIYKNFKGCLLY